MGFDDHDEPHTLFHRDGDNRYVPTGWCRGPWDQGAMHGGAPAALLTMLADQHDSLVPMRIVRLAFDILKPVPLSPLQVTAAVEREGKRIQVLQLVLSEDDVEVMRVRALRMRRGDHPLPANAPTGATLETLDLPPPEDLAEHPFPAITDWGPMFAEANELRPSTGSLLSEMGPGACWWRLRVPVLDDEPATPAARAASVADFGNGLAGPVPFLDWIYLNADLMVMLQREPVDEWVGMSSLSVPATDGTGLTMSRLADRTGQIGVATQSLYLEPRG